MKILIIDDAEPLRALIREILSQAGWAAVEAADGRAGLLAARTHLPDLILCDFEMPGLNGFETLAAVRQDPATATIPFILMTGADHKAGLRRSMDLGADDYLTKPFEPATLLKAVEARVDRAKLSRRQTEQKLYALRTGITAALPHELKTPLNGILGYADMLRKDTLDFSREEIRAIANDIHQCGTRLNRLVDRFLHYTELLSLAASAAPTRARPRLEPDEVTMTLEEMARQVAGENNRGPDLQLHLGSGLPAADLDQLSRLTRELLDNACKFSAPGTSIRLTTRQQGGQFLIEVSDTGCGLTPAQIRDTGALMQFDRLRHEQQGTGLGLAIARLLAELNDGTLELSSEPSHGTTARVSLPLLS